MEAFIIFLIATGLVLSTPFLIWMSYMGPDERTSAVVLLVTYWTVQALNNAGFRVNHIDIAPRYMLQQFCDELMRQNWVNHK